MPKHKDRLTIVFVKAKSHEDICRYVYNFDFTSEPLLLEKAGKEFRLMALGEAINNKVIAYYTDIGRKAKLARYTPPFKRKHRKCILFGQCRAAKYT